MSDISQGLGHVDPLLTGIAIDFFNTAEDSIAELLFPTHFVPRRSGKYFVYDKGNTRNVETKRGDGAGANEVTYGLTQASYGPIIEHALKARVTSAVAEDIGRALAEKNAAMRSAGGLMMSRELELATSMADTAVLTNNTTLSGTDQWSDGANSDPVSDVETGKTSVYENSFQEANTLVLSREALAQLRQHPDLVGRINGLATSVSIEDMKSIFGLDNIIIARGRYETARQGATSSIGNIWGKHAWVLFINPSAPQDREYITLGHTLRVEGTGVGTSVTKFNDPDPTTKQNWVSVESSWEHKFMSVECAYLIKDAVA